MCKWKLPKKWLITNFIVQALSLHIWTTINIFQENTNILQMTFCGQCSCSFSLNFLLFFSVSHAMSITFLKTLKNNYKIESWAPCFLFHSVVLCSAFSSTSLLCFAIQIKHPRRKTLVSDGLETFYTIIIVLIFFFFFLHNYYCYFYFIVLQ